MNKPIMVKLAVSTPEYAEHLESMGFAGARIFEIKGRDDLLEATKTILRLMEGRVNE